MHSARHTREGRNPGDIGQIQVLDFRLRGIDGICYLRHAFNRVTSGYRPCKNGADSYSIQSDFHLLLFLLEALPAIASKAPLAFSHLPSAICHLQNFLPPSIRHKKIERGEVAMLKTLFKLGSASPNVTHAALTEPGNL